MDFCEILISHERIVVPSAELEPHQCGAAIDFLGIVRPLEDGRPLDGIRYEAHPRMAERELRLIVAGVAASQPELRACRLTHRVGFVPSGETSLFARVCCAHRDEAYAASRILIEELKRRAPIWKHPIFTAS
ncbi:MAG TPA: molybdenum cofactor biosynthesis protein MoaE [Chthoniobacterales bacterium]|jgi:molybdopterin synthase catalytic subunit|nr:molybdenum cofactor biosynthesis protein MoaE [Chthoniobacterales bacterium]